MPAGPDASRQSRWIIFTDASLEDGDQRGYIGMVALRVVVGQVVGSRFFAEEIPGFLMERWQKRTRKIIGLLELFAAVLAVEMLSNSIKQERIFLYVDNESARSSLISMYSPLEAHNNLLRRFQRVVMSAGLFCLDSARALCI